MSCHQDADEDPNWSVYTEDYHVDNYSDLLHSNGDHVSSHAEHYRHGVNGDSQQELPHTGVRLLQTCSTTVSDRESKTTPTHLLPSPQTDCGLTAPGLPRSFSRTPGPSSRSVSSVCRSWTPSPRCWSLSLSCMTWRHCTHCTGPGSLSEAGQPPPHSQCCPRPLCPAEGRTLPFISTECLV